MPTPPNLNILDYVQNVSTKIYSRGDTIFKEGDQSDGAMYFVFGGSVSVFRNQNGKEEKINHITQGGFFGEVALLSSEPRSATVRVDDDEMAKIGILDQRTFVQVARTTPAFLYQLLRVVLDRLKKTENRLTDAQRKILELGGEL